MGIFDDYLNSNTVQGPLRDRVKTYLEGLDKVATGSTLESLGLRLRELRTGVELTVSLSGGAPFFDTGIDPETYKRNGTYPPVQPLEEWLKSRRIDLKYLFPILAKIRNVGVEGFNFSEPLEKVLLDEMEDIFASPASDTFVFDRIIRNFTPPRR